MEKDENLLFESREKYIDLGDESVASVVETSASEVGTSGYTG